MNQAQKIFNSFVCSGVYFWAGQEVFVSEKEALIIDKWLRRLNFRRGPVETDGEEKNCWYSLPYIKEAGRKRGYSFCANMYN